MAYADEVRKHRSINIYWRSFVYVFSRQGSTGEDEAIGAGSISGRESSDSYAVVDKASFKAPKPCSHVRGMQMRRPSVMSKCHLH